MKTIDELLAEFDIKAQSHGWARDSGPAKVAKEAEQGYNQAKAALMEQVAWYQAELERERARIEWFVRAIESRDKQIQALQAPKLNPPETAPKDMVVFMGDFGYPWMLYACWNPHEGEYVVATQQMNMVNGVCNDPYFECEYAKPETLKGWLPLRQNSWVDVSERLPSPGEMVLVYSPPQPGDWPGSVRIEFDEIDAESDGQSWRNHSANYEHFCCVAKGGDDDLNWVGPSEKAPYTHWLSIPAIPKPVKQ